MAATIWYVSKYVAPPGRGAVGGRGYLLMKELAAMGHCVSMITSDSNQLASPPPMRTNFLFQDVDGIQLCWVRTMKYSAAKSLRRIMSWLDFEWCLLFLPCNRFPPPDVVIVSSLSLLTILNGFRWRFRYKCRLVFEIRDIWPMTIVEEGGFSPWNPFVFSLGFIERLGYKYADVIVGTMPNLGEHVSNILGYPKPTYCIPMGLDETVFSSLEELPSDYIKKYFPENKFLVAHVGSIGIANALDTFLDCAESMQENSLIHFMIVGNGDLRNAYIAKYAHLTNLTFAPFVSKSMVQAVLSKCDLLYFSVHASNVWRYGQSLNKVIDYMMSGKPVIASYTGYETMINESGCGSYVPAGDVLALRHGIQSYAIMDKVEREKIGKRGKEWLIKNRPYQKLAVDYLSVMGLDVNNKSSVNA